MNFIPIIMHLNEGRGHVLNYQRSVREAVIGLNWAYTPILASSPVDEIFIWQPNICQVDGGLIDKERHIVLSNLRRGRLLHFLWSTIKFGFEIREKIKQSTRQDVKNIVFIECFNPLQLLCIFIGLIGVGSDIQLLMVIRGSINWGGKKHRLLAGFYGYGNYFLMKIFGRFCEFKILTDSSILQANLACFYRRPVYEIPIPHGYSMKRGNDGPCLPNMLRLWSPGSQRPDKGQKTLDWLVKNNFFSEENIEFFSAQKDHRLANKKLEPNLVLRSLDQALSETDYYRMFGKVDFVLFPYDPKVYAESTSGPFVEAICNNCLPVVTAGTWMASELKKHGLTNLVVQFDENIISTLLELKEDVSIKVKLLEMSRAYQTRHSISGLAAEFLKIA